MAKEKEQGPSKDVILEKLSSLKELVENFKTDVTSKFQAINETLSKNYVTDDQLAYKLLPLESNAKRTIYLWGIILIQFVALLIFAVQWIITHQGGQ